MTPGSILVEKSPLAPSSLKIAYEVIEHPPLLKGCDHLKLTELKVDKTSLGARTPLGTIQLVITAGSLIAPSPLKLTADILKE